MARTADNAQTVNSRSLRIAHPIPGFGLSCRLSADTFIEKYSTNVSLGGVFIQSRSPKPPGSALKFELALENGEVLIKGEGQVTWVREFDANAPGQPFGMGVRFTNLDAKSRALVERAVAHRQTRGAGEPTPSTFAPAAGKPASRPPARSAAHTPPLSPPAPSTAPPAALDRVGDRVVRPDGLGVARHRCVHGLTEVELADDLLQDVALGEDAEQTAALDHQHAAGRLIAGILVTP